MQLNLKRPTKKWWIIGSLVATLLIIAGLVFWDIMAWRAYEQSYVSQYATLKESAEKAMAMQVGDAAARQKKYDALVSVSGELSRSEHACDVPVLLRWQRAIPPLNDLVLACERQQQKHQKFMGDLQKIITYLRAERDTAKILQPTVSGKLEESALKQQPQLWADVRKALEKPSDSREFESTRTKLVEKVAAIQPLWEKLLAASDAKDRAKYEEAVGALAGAYQALSELMTSTNETFAPMAVQLLKSYTEAFDKP